MISFTLISYRIYKLRTYQELNEKNIITAHKEEISIPELGERIRNPDESETVLGKIKRIEGRIIYIELDDETLPIKTDDKTTYLIAYSKPGQPEIKPGSFQDIEIDDILSVNFIKGGDGSFVSQYIVINK